MRTVTRGALRVATWLGFVFCVLSAYLFGTSGQWGFSFAFAALGLPYAWLIVGSPRPRRGVEEVLRAIAQRPRADHHRIAQLEIARCSTPESVS